MGRYIFRYAARATVGALVVWASVRAPTWLLMRVGGISVRDADLLGMLIGGMAIATIGVGVLVYQRNARQP